ncbi:uncharacterized protein il17rc [Lampris incognitus]|uniref:uncharacterized protein il17rc n=1 Tax=Lampris incognitus TaxID=2546036 RepID=UPI0024B5262F|nr:uncharacterized protein il17rc [Lampris incognitus]
MVSPGCSIGHVLLTIAMPAFALELIAHDVQEVVCSQGLSECTVKDESPIALPGRKNNAVDIRDLKAQVKLCCEDGAMCPLCLVIDMLLSIQLSRANSRTGQRAASVKVCYTPSSLPICKRVEFTVNRETLAQQNKAHLSLVIKKPQGVSFSSRVQVSVHPTKQRHLIGELVVPSLDEVCVSDLQEHIKECNAPRLNSIVHQARKLVQLEVVGRNSSLLDRMCLQYERNGRCQPWCSMTVPLFSVTPCTCFQIWWDEGDQRSRRSVSCPFGDRAGVFQRTVWENVTMSVVQGQMTSAGSMLLWSLSAPCRLEGEVWPCHRTQGATESWCEETKGLRQQLSNGTWRQNSKGLWEIQGAFEGINLQLSPCAMVKVKERKNELGPFCYNNTSRWRWPLLVFALALLICSAVLLHYLLHDEVKGWARRWYYDKCVKAGTRHVVLLSPPDADDVVSRLMCGLGSLLCDRGFSVSVDQWSRTEQGSSGPLPWLHSQLLQVERLGGRVILVLTGKARERTEEWTHQQQQQQQQQHTEAKGKVQDKGLTRITSPYSDVFTASLSCVKADKQLGRARERFLLVDFESHPAHHPCHKKHLPELFRGLPLFHLPSQRRALLYDLARGRGKGSGGRKRTEPLQKQPTAGDDERRRRDVFVGKKQKQKARTKEKTTN